MTAPLEQMEARARGLAEVIDQGTPQGWGFVLIHFRFDSAGKNATYISNCNRADMVRAMRETADRIEAKTTDELTDHDPPGPVQGL